MSNTTGIILAGGASTRMGQDKALLPWGDATLLEHLVMRFHNCFQPFIVAGQAFPALSTLPETVLQVIDATPHQGPMAGFLTGLNYSPPDQNVFLAGCDFPFLESRVVGFLQLHLKDADAVVTEKHGKLQPLVGLYRADIKKQVQQLVDRGKRSMHSLLETIKVNVITEEQWSTFDPTGIMLTNINTPDEYQAALQTYLASLGT